MEIPNNVTTYELQESIVWIDNDGIVYSVPKPGITTNFSKESSKQDMIRFGEITGNKKVCLIIESNPHSKPPAKEQRDFIADQLNSFTKAMAIIITSPVSKMIANLFFGLKPPKYPAKMFTSVEDAREWVKQYL